jgi:hypothetical protein
MFNAAVQVVQRLLNILSSNGGKSLSCTRFPNVIHRNIPAGITPNSSKRRIGHLVDRRQSKMYEPFHIRARGIAAGTR